MGSNSVIRAVNERVALSALARGHIDTLPAERALSKFVQLANEQYVCKRDCILDPLPTRQGNAPGANLLGTLSDRGTGTASR